MENDTAVLKKRLTELSERAENYGCAFYTDFLSLSEQSVLEELNLKATLFGGYPLAERKLARFGESYGEDFPAVFIKIEPLQKKFADKLTHRDFLGSILGLGLKRSVLGDIIVHDNCGYLVCLDSIADFIVSELEKVKHTNVRCEKTDALPQSSGELPPVTSVVVPSERIDAIVAEVFNLSRSESRRYFDKELVFINSKLVRKAEKTPEPDDIISVRGLGRFIYAGIDRTTAKGRLRVLVRRFT